MSFTYSFDMSKVIGHFKSLPKDIQASAECNAVDVIYESFVIPADQDYLMARLLAQKGLPRGFYWAAAQAIEKYLKAFLLMNGESVKEFKGHPLKALFDAATKIDASLADLDILPHPSIQVEISVSQHLKKFVIADFIEDLATHGSADNRYNAFGVRYNTGHLCAMDSLSFHLRGKIGVVRIGESFKNLNPDLLAFFEIGNPWFHVGETHPMPEIPSKEFPIQYSSSTTKFEFLMKNKNQPAYKLALQWLNARMKLPKSVAAAK